MDIVHLLDSLIRCWCHPAPAPVMHTMPLIISDVTW